MELHFLWPGLRDTLGIFLYRGLNKFLLKLSGFCQHRELLAKTAYLIPHSVTVRRQWYFSPEEGKDGGTPEWLPKCSNHHDSRLAFCPVTAEFHPVMWPTFLLRWGCWPCSPVLFESRRNCSSQQRKGFRAKSEWVGKRLGPWGLCLRNNHSCGHKQNLCWGWRVGGTKRMGRVILFCLPILIRTFTRPH